MTTKHQVSSLEIYVAWKQYWMESKIRRIWVGLILLYESVGICNVWLACWMLNCFEIQSCTKVVNLNKFKMVESQISINLFGAL